MTPGSASRSKGRTSRSTGRGFREIRLKPGPYTVEARKDGKVVRRELVHVTRDGRPVVRITQGPTPVAKAAGSADDATAWEASVAALPAAEQVEAVARRLKERNPGFDGAVTPTIRDGVVTGLRFTGDHVSDISPVRALTRLRGMRLQSLCLRGSGVSDLTPIVGMPIRSMTIDKTPVTDLSPLKGLPLRELTCDFRASRDAKTLREIVSLKTINGKPAARFWKELEPRETN